MTLEGLDLRERVGEFAALIQKANFMPSKSKP